MFNNLAASAEDAGAVIDRSTIAKAEAFDTAWKKLSALLSSQMKAAAGDVAGFLDDLITKAGEFFAELAKGSAAQNGGLTGQQKFNAMADALAVATKEALGLAQDMNQLTRVIDAMVAKGGDPDIIRGLEAARDKAKEAQAEIAKAGMAWSMSQFPGGVPLPGARPAGANAPDPNAAKLPSRAGEEADDAFDRAAAALQRRTATMKADTATTFDNVGAQAKLRAEFGSLNAIVQDEGEVTEAQLKRYEELRLSMSATQALQAAGIALTKEHAAAFAKNSEEIAKATIENAKAADSLRKLNSASQTIGSALSTAFADAVVEGKNLNDVVASLIKTLEKAALNALIMRLFHTRRRRARVVVRQAVRVRRGHQQRAGRPCDCRRARPRARQSAEGRASDPERRDAPARRRRQLVYAPAIDARGASVEAVARLAQVLEADRASFASRTVATIQQARRGRVPGL